MQPHDPDSAGTIRNIVDRQFGRCFNPLAAATAGIDAIDTEPLQPLFHKAADLGFRDIGSGHQYRAVFAGQQIDDVTPAKIGMQRILAPPLAQQFGVAAGCIHRENVAEAIDVVGIAAFAINLAS